MKDIHVFMHIPKCGGMTARQYYKQLFDKILMIQDRYLPARKFPHFETVMDYDAIVGHIPLLYMVENRVLADAVRSNQVRLTIHSIIRDPIDRVISEYNFKKSNPAHPQYEEMQSTDGREYVLGYQTNYQSKFLSVSDEPAEADAVATRINLISIDNSVKRLRNYFAAQSFDENVPEAEVANVTAKQFSKSHIDLLKRNDFTDEEIVDLTGKHSKDLDLYERSKEHQDTVHFTF